MKNHTLSVITEHALINPDYSLTHSRETHMVFKQKSQRIESMKKLDINN